MTFSRQPADITVRDLTHDDRPSIAALAKRAFPATQAAFVQPSDAGGAVAIVDGKIAAASLVRVIRLPSGNRVGMIAWLMTDPAYRGLGLASRVVRASTAHLHELGCSAVVTDVEGYNTGSANIFHAEGFSRLGAWQQLKSWNPLDLVWLWLRTGLAIDPGHFLWATDKSADAGPSPWRARIGAIAMNAGFVVLALVLGGGLLLPGSGIMPAAVDILAILAGITLILLVREGCMRAAAGPGRHALEFRAWEGGWGMSLIINFLFGSVLPLPGNLYPKGDGWRTKDHSVALGRAAVASAVVLAGLVLAASALRTPETLLILDRIAWTVVVVGKPLLVFDTVVAVAPFEGYNARHLRDYNKPVWLSLAGIAIAVFVWG